MNEEQNINEPQNPTFLQGAVRCSVVMVKELNIGDLFYYRMPTEPNETPFVLAYKDENICVGANWIGRTPSSKHFISGVIAEREEDNKINIVQNAAFGVNCLVRKHCT